MWIKLTSINRAGLTVGMVAVLVACGSAKTSPFVLEIDNDATANNQTTTLASSLGLRIEAEHRGGYKRTLFPDWYDADKSGCDTRQEVLIAESMTPPVIGVKCAVAGTWLSVYDGVTTTNPSKIDIDHMVPLKEAWDSGAWKWKEDKRRKFANDLDASYSLIAVTASSNRSKSEKDPAEWMPKLKSYRCEYARTWVKIKRDWVLSVDPAENTFLTRTKARC
jgi:hypothetical protein